MGEINLEESLTPVLEIGDDNISVYIRPKEGTCFEAYGLSQGIMKAVRLDGKIFIWEPMEGDLERAPFTKRATINSQASDLEIKTMDFDAEKYFVLWGPKEYDAAGISEHPTFVYGVNSVQIKYRTPDGTVRLVPFSPYDGQEVSF